VHGGYGLLHNMDAVGAVTNNERHRNISIDDDRNDDSERKKDLWVRVKGALNRWAQLRRMTKFGMTWLSEASKVTEQERAEFESRHGFSYEFVITFPHGENSEAFDEADTASLWGENPAESLKNDNGDPDFDRHDIVRQLQECGLETETYPSVQGDEIICLIRVPPNILGAFCEANKVELELDPSKLEHLCYTGSPAHEIDANPVPHDELVCEYRPYEHIFAPYHRRVHEHFKCGLGINHPFDRLVRLRLIPIIIQSDIEFDQSRQGGAGLKLGDLKKQGKVLDYFGLHNEGMRQTVYNNWVIKSTWPWALPVNLIRSYFGEKVALFFSFTAHYTSWLLPLALLGFVTQLQIMQNGYNDATMLVVFAAAVSVWFIFMLESWKRKEWQHILVWGMSHFFTAESERPEFEGEIRPSLIDGTPTVYYSDFQRRINALKSFILTTSFIVVNLTLQIAIFAVRTVISGRNDEGRTQQFMLLASSLATSLQINFADGMYKKMAIWLTDLENHRLDSLYYDSLILKFSIFQLFNNFSSLFYVGFVKPYLGIECQTVFESTNPCMHELGFMLGIVFMSDVFSNMVMEILVPRVKTKWRAYMEGHDTDQSSDPVGGGVNGDGVVASVAEQEAVLEQYDVILDLLMDYKTINIQFGYLTFFVAALPILPVIAFAANVVEMRVDGHKLLKEHKCPSSVGASNIGMWHSVFTAYGLLAVISNSALVCFRTNIIQVEQQSTLIWLFFLFQYGVFAGMILVSILVDETPKAVSVQLKRQDHFNDNVLANLIAGGSDVLERFRDEALRLTLKGQDDNYGSIFSLLSIDGQAITAHSLKLGLNLIGFKTTDLDMKILMNRIDADRSGVLELDEFQAFCMATSQEDVRLICRRLRRRLGNRIDEVMNIFEKYDLDGDGTIDASELQLIFTRELRIDVSEKESATLIARFDIDNSGTISVEEFARFLTGDLAIDSGELALKLQELFKLCERNGMSVVKLFTAVDKKNSGLVPFNAVKAILHKYIGVTLSSFELSILRQQYHGATDDNFCRYTDLYSDVMTAKPDKVLDVTIDAAEADGTESESLAKELDHMLNESASVVSKGTGSNTTTAGGGAQMLITQLDWYTPIKMAHALARLAADYAAIGDLTNAEALYQHSIALARAVEQEGDTSASLGILEDASTGATKLAGLGHELIELDQRLATARNDLLTVIKGNDRFLRRHGPSTKNEAASRAKEAAHAIEQQRDLMREDPQPSSDEKDVSVEAVTQRRSSLLHRAAQRRSTPPPNRVLESILRGEKTKPTYPSRNSSTVAVGKKSGQWGDTATPCPKFSIDGLHAETCEW